MKTTHQYITRKLNLCRGVIFADIEKIVLYILKKFRFLEIGEVIAVWPEKGRVKCRMINQKGKTSKWMKVISPFASRFEGIYAMPNVGDFGGILFALGDLCNGYYFGSFWGEKTPVPTYSRTGKEIVITRNGSTVAIEPNGNIRLKHRDGNEVLLTPGNVQQKTPDGQKNVTQKYYVAKRTAGTKEPFDAIAYAKNEAKNQKDVVLFKRSVEEPEGSISSYHCLVDQKNAALGASTDQVYVPPVSSANETVKQVRARRYRDVGNASSGTNAFGWTKTEEHFHVPAGGDLALSDPDDHNVIEKNAETCFNVWIDNRCYATFKLSAVQRLGQALAKVDMEVWSDGLVGQYTLTPDTPDVTGQFYQNFERSIKREIEYLEEVDGDSMTRVADIERGTHG